MEDKVKISTNWSLLRGKNISETLVVEIKNDATTNEKTSIDDIVSFEQSIHLQRNQKPKALKEDANFNIKQEDCEVFFKIDPHYVLMSLNLVTDCSTVEIFVNIHREYYNTYFGEFLDDFDGMRIYRYDINFTSKCSHFIAKLIPRVPEIWIYGMQITLRNFDESAASVLSKQNINVSNVESILSDSNQRLSTKAEQCKSFVEYFLQANASKQAFEDQRHFTANWPTELETLKTQLENTKIDSTESNNLPLSSVGGNTKHGSREAENYIHEFQTELKTYIDKLMLNLETRLNLKLEDIEKRQNEKLDKIIEMMSVQHTCRRE